MSKEKECWVCHRKLSEVIEAGNKIGYEPITCEEDPKEVRKNAMFDVDTIGCKVTVCTICRDIMFEVSRDSLLDAIHCGVGNYRDDIVTYKDMENMTLEVDLGEAPSHRNKVKGKLASNANQKSKQECSSLSEKGSKQP